MLDSFKDKTTYFKLINAIEMQEAEMRNLYNSKEYVTGSFLTRTKKTILSVDFKKLRGYLRNRKWNKFVKKSNRKKSIEHGLTNKTEDYFSHERIAVYSVLFGNYDVIQEPLFKPDNIDYYIVTDQIVPETSLWEKIKWDKSTIEGFTDTEKNRYFKMHPEILFPEYRYSIYLDANIKVITDLTPFIYRIGDAGMAFHSHSQRVCAYEELEALRYSYKSDKASIEKYKKYLETNSFPKNYGLLECNVIARQHDTLICKKIMQHWWIQFKNNIHRDQVSLPYVLYENGISVSEVSTLGDNINNNLSFRVVRHSQ